MAETELACDFDRMRQEQIPSSKAGVACFDVIFTPIRRDGGSPPDEFVILFKDVTRDRRERRKLTFRETRYHAFFENACNGVIIIEPLGGDEYVFKDLNQAAEEILCVSKEDLVGRRVFDVFPDLDTTADHEIVVRVMATGKPAFLPPLRYRRGEELWIWHYLFRLPSGELASFMLDVSEEVGDGAGPFVGTGHARRGPGAASSGPDPAA